MMIAIPTALQIFCWIATMWTGRLDLRTPMLFNLAFFFILVLGGLTGIMVASVPLDLQLHDTYFVVAHLHYVLIGGAVFPLFGAWYYWFPKITGRLMSERLGRLQFWLFFIGFNVAFYPMHHLGLQGMPRRVYTYADEMGWGPLNLLISVGAFVIALSVLLFIVNVVSALRRGAIAGDNPWGAGTLEWGTASPPPAYNFDHPPIVRTREPLWEPLPEAPAEPTHVSGLAESPREALITTVVDAMPDHRATFPEPSVWPFVSSVAVSVMFIGSIFTPWAIVWGGIPVAIFATLWFWPKRAETEAHLAVEKRP
jgi:cytochrome c oxidase subunit 1